MPGMFDRTPYLSVLIFSSVTQGGLMACMEGANSMPSLETLVSSSQEGDVYSTDAVCSERARKTSFWAATALAVRR